VRLDHLLSKECCRLFNADHYPVEHWLFGSSRIPADDRPPLICCALHGELSPPITDRSLRKLPDSHYSVLRERPNGSIPVTSFRRVRGRGSCARPSESSLLGSSRPGSLPARCVGGPLTPCVPRSGGVLAGRCLSGGGARPRRALCCPLRIPKRARASLFSKLQRANGGCLGA
jgi:hypothetical protein